MVRTVLEDGQRGLTGAVVYCYRLNIRSKEQVDRPRSDDPASGQDLAQSI